MSFVCAQCVPQRMLRILSGRTAKCWVKILPELGILGSNTPSFVCLFLLQSAEAPELQQEPVGVGAGAPEAAAAEKEPPAANIPTAIKYQDDNSLAHPNVSVDPILLCRIYPTLGSRAAPGMRAGLWDPTAPHTIPALG